MRASAPACLKANAVEDSTLTYFLIACAQYIKVDAPLAVNIPAKHRAAIQQFLEAYEACIGEVRELLHQVDNPRKSFTLPAASVVQLTPILEQLANAYSDAYFEIRRLLVQDSWPRFRLSRYYKQVRGARLSQARCSRWRASGADALFCGNSTRH